MEKKNLALITLREKSKKNGIGLKHFLAILTVIAVLVSLQSCEKDPRDSWIEGLWERLDFYGFESISVEIKYDNAVMDFFYDTSREDFLKPVWLLHDWISTGDEVIKGIKLRTESKNKNIYDAQVLSLDNAYSGTDKNRKLVWKDYPITVKGNKLTIEDTPDYPAVAGNKFNRVKTDNGGGNNNGGGISNEWVDIQGVKWAKGNVDKPGTFVKKQEDIGGYYTWNEAQTVCPQGWRVPTLNDIENLIRNPSGGYIDKNEVGEFAAGKLILPKAGVYNIYGEFLHKGKYGWYWTSSLGLMYQESRLGVHLYFGPGLICAPDANLLDTKMQVRCVKK